MRSGCASPRSPSAAIAVLSALRSRGREAETLLPYATKWFEPIISVLPMYAKEIDSGDYSDPAASVDLFHTGAADLAVLTELLSVGAEGSSTTAKRP
ncbi:hypothetical protein [Amycolatopsis regifaucium]|nr:hypothetical protein [Amycolatopsis regifaucium]SFJ61158.1 hypothetical protein SAMN04489731_1275 [Amycolatopsis regifaucium]